MKEFDDPEGTWPKGKALKRLKQKTRQLINKLERMSVTAGNDLRLLDVGCSNGAFVYAAGLLGVNAAGVEPSPGPARHAIKNGLTVYQGFLEDMHFARGSFDVITLFEVIEHLKTPLALMKACRRILKPGGCMVIRTGNTDSWTVRCMKGRWGYFHINIHGGHVSFFNPLSMKLLAERSEFTVAELKTHSVGLYEKGDIPFVAYRAAKLLGELLNTPSKWFGKGHEMIVFLKKNDMVNRLKD
jgi:SAM-dependent methyltransferase